MKEIWKDIPGFEGFYQVSNLGRVRSLDRYATYKRGRKKFIKGRIRSVKHSGGWYLTLPLLCPGNKKTVRIHQLVAEVFIGPRPSKKHHVHHKDGNMQNNRVDNLEYILPKEHCLITVQENPEVIRAMNHYNRVVRPKRILQYDLSGNLIAEHLNGHNASQFSGVCHRNILQVASQTEYKPGLTRKQAGGYVWKYKEDGITSLTK